MELLRFNFYVAHKVITSAAAAALPLGTDETIGACPLFLSKNKKNLAPPKMIKLWKKEARNEMDEKILS